MCKNHGNKKVRLFFNSICQLQKTKTRVIEMKARFSVYSSIHMGTFCRKFAQGKKGNKSSVWGIGCFEKKEIRRTGLE
jgi:hypothetical protein